MSKSVYEVYCVQGEIKSVIQIISNAMPPSMIAEGTNELIKVMLKELLKTISISIGVILSSHVVLYLFSKLSFLDRYYPFVGEILFLITIVLLIVIFASMSIRYNDRPTLSDYRKDYIEEYCSPDNDSYYDVKYNSIDCKKKILTPNTELKKRNILNWILILFSVLFSLALALALLYLLYRGFLVLIGNGFFLQHNLLFTAILIFAILQFTLRKSRYKNQSWKKLTDVWLKLTQVSTLSTGGFGLLGLELKDTLYAPLLKADFVDIGFLGVSYAIVVLFVGTAHLLITVGKASSNDDDSREPKEWFVPSYATVWIGCFGMHTLFFNGLFLTLYAYMTSS